MDQKRLLEAETIDNKKLQENTHPNLTFELQYSEHPILGRFKTDWLVYLVCRSFSHSENLCVAPGPPKLTQDVSNG